MIRRSVRPGTGVRRVLGIAALCLIAVLLATRAVQSNAADTAPESSSVGVPAAALSAPAVPTPAAPVYARDGVLLASTTTVTTLESPVPLGQLIASTDDLYLAKPDLVRRYILHGLPRALQFTQVMRWKEGADKLIMGKPRDMFLNGNQLYVLDSLGSLWSYFGPTYGRTLLPLRLQTNQGDPTAVALYGPQLLLLDPDKRQIWVYDPSGSPGQAYDSVPHPLFAHSNRLLTGGRRMAAAPTGVYVLGTDGPLLWLPWGRPAATAPVQLPAPATGVWANPSVSYALVSTARDIVRIDARGKVTWRVHVGGLNGESIADLAYSAGGNLYVLTDTRILRVQVQVPRA